MRIQLGQTERHKLGKPWVVLILLLLCHTYKKQPKTIVLTAAVSKIGYANETSHSSNPKVGVSQSENGQHDRAAAGRRLVGRVLAEMS